MKQLKNKINRGIMMTQKEGVEKVISRMRMSGRSQYQKSVGKEEPGPGRIFLILYCY